MRIRTQLRQSGFGRRTHQDPTKLIPTKSRFEAVLADPSTVSLDFGPAPPGRASVLPGPWCWSECALYGATGWIALTKAPVTIVTWRMRMRVWATTAYLYDQDEHLYYRDTAYLAARHARPQIFWDAQRLGVCRLARI